ncbi:MAG: hypothetical protein ACR2PT_08770 [Endozoicomonas sp.]
MKAASCTAIILVGLVCSLNQAVAAEDSFIPGYDDGLRPYLLNYLQTDDPVRAIPRDTRLVEDARKMVEAARNHQWNDESLRSNRSFDLLLYAYVNRLIDRLEFLDIQDYLQIQADFAVPETAGFAHDSEPARIPALSMRRIHYSELSLDDFSGIHYRAFSSTTFSPLAWATEIIVNEGFMKEFQEETRDSEKCSDIEQGEMFRCLSQLTRDKRKQLLLWLELLSDSLTDLHSFEGNRLLFGSIPLHLHATAARHSPDFLPLYGELSWEQVIRLREQGKNPGTLYHPRVLTNFLEPHNLYGGASLFVRHDLIHQHRLKNVPQNYRNFFAWLHRQESSIVSLMDKALLELDFSTLDARYEDIGIHPSMSFLSQTCQRLQEDISFSKSPTPIQPVTAFWQKPRQHRSLFSGVFADMEIITRYKKGGVYLADTLMRMLGRQCKNAAFNFPSSFELYHSLLEGVLRSSYQYIRDEFGIEMEPVLDAMRKKA